MAMARVVEAMPMREMSKGVETCFERSGGDEMLSISFASSMGKAHFGFGGFMMVGFIGCV